MHNPFLNKNSFATTLILALFNELGMDMFTYEPETIEEFIKKRNPNATKALINRANAAIGIYTSDLFWTDPVTFGTICRTLNRKAKPEYKEPDLEDIAWGVTEANLIIGDEDAALNHFSSAIKRYVAVLLQENGVYDTPETFKDLEAPAIDTTIIDSDQMLSIQQRSDEVKADIDGQVYDKMSELLKQIAALNIDLSEDAKKELKEFKAL